MTRDSRRVIRNTWPGGSADTVLGDTSNHLMTRHTKLSRRFTHIATGGLKRCDHAVTFFFGMSLADLSERGTTTHGRRDCLCSERCRTAT